MIVWNAHRTTAIVIRHDGHQVRLVPMKSGRLKVLRATRRQFEAEWRSHEYPLDKALVAFMEHARQHGATAEALRGLETLVHRDDPVIHPLF